MILWRSATFGPVTFQTTAGADVFPNLLRLGLVSVGVLPSLIVLLVSFPFSFWFLLSWLSGCRAPLFLSFFFYFFFLLGGLELEARASCAGAIPGSRIPCIFNNNSLFYSATSRHESNSEYLVNRLSLYCCMCTRFSLCMEVKVFSSMSLSEIVSPHSFRWEVIL